jgi:hypothetical protein
VFIRRHFDDIVFDPFRRVFIRRHFDDIVFDPFHAYNSNDANDNNVWDDSDPDYNYYLQKQHEM